MLLSISYAKDANRPGVGGEQIRELMLWYFMAFFFLFSLILTTLSTKSFLPADGHKRLSDAGERTQIDGHMGEASEAKSESLPVRQAGEAQMKLEPSDRVELRVE